MGEDTREWFNEARYCYVNSRCGLNSYKKRMVSKDAAPLWRKFKDGLEEPILKADRLWEIAARLESVVRVVGYMGASARHGMYYALCRAIKSRAKEVPFSDKEGLCTAVLGLDR